MQGDLCIALHWLPCAKEAVYIKKIGTMLFTDEIQYQLLAINNMDEPEAR